MHKLKLDVGELRIESLEVHAEVREPLGTVHGAQQRGMTVPATMCSTNDWCAAAKWLEAR
ncbi:MAG TPA: hypothetical protein VFS20_32485, partial [Longimicrobium sp.]|nr:hypothetical protein [Longimicrobium sp.]